MNKALRLFGGVCGKIVVLALVVCFIVRIVLAAMTAGPLGIGFGGWLAVFGLGLVNDLCVTIICLVFLWAFLLSFSDAKFRRPWGYILLAIPTLLFLWVLCFNTPFHEYGSVVPKLALGLFGFWALSFALRLFLPQMRPGWRKFWFWAFVGTYVCLIYFNGVCEFFFWNEFTVRYNFIAVDYLVYTNEVVGNILESYAIAPLVAGVLVATVVTTWWLFRRDARELPVLVTCGDVAGLETCSTLPWKGKGSLVWAVCAALSLWLVTVNTRFQQTGNSYFDELQANGVYKLIDAFRKNHLDYEQFYVTLPDAEEQLHALYGSTGKNLRHVEADSAAILQQPNIVLITMESMSADFMARYGNEKGLTPNLDSLAQQALTFDNLIATGNRTVRGLEALTLSLPPCPGESIIKRPDCSGMNSTAKMLQGQGYRSLFFYGGKSYFDNMGAFFGGNGYEIIDEASYKPEEITFKNIWGVSDEDSFHKALQVIDTIAPAGPFFAHIMTISNHRPYTYPEGRIPIPTDSKTRAGGVMYADWAIGDFMRRAAREPWFDNTVFVIVADHCASSAGKTELPLEKYHIPAMIYAPGKIAPQAVKKFCSQIDLMPTLFALMSLEYDSHFYGHNILADDFQERAFLATYEDLGYLEDGVLTVLSPVRRVEQFRVEPTADNPYNTEPIAPTDSAKIRRAAMYYQTSAAFYAPEK